MKQLILGLALFSLAGSALAAAKPCEELKAEIDAKLKAKGVAAYSLEVVDKGSAGDKSVVGTCEAGSKEIVYQRG
ncbi:DUF1161 domain-containing protein [Aquipseudomonas campi]|jgi:hypothetical protein|uniref:DUF1161 domain-containing protein n=2 Tax=Aquipseudomonas TaxID=3236652 RepID=A0A6M8FFX2_9GAMM|nr:MULTISPECIES: DUF1161 domain-containing protein [Pseudomonas]MBB1518616.1 DUF1161 domain-containing protein [Pseudomonas guryensis]QKE65113.1 DUF1161 domain-containing protein [Pseudomonas campi]